MSQGHCVIIGNGPAGNQAAMTLKEKAPDLKVTVIGQERARHYRPHLLPDFISGRIPEEDLYVNPLGFYKEKGIILRLGQRVVDVNFEQRIVFLDHKEVIPYDGLVLAVGAKPRIPEPLERFSRFMLTLKTVGDAGEWIERLAGVESVLIIGGDLTSLSLTKALLDMGKKVSFFVNDDSFWPVRCMDEVRNRVVQLLTERGVRVLEGRRIINLEQAGNDLIRVSTDRGIVDTQLVGAFYGLTPDVKFLNRSGLDIDRGILVNEYLQTRFPEAYAAGDCAQVYHPDLKDYWVSIGYGNALELGKIAALNLVGRRISAQVEPESIFSVDGITANVSWWMEF